MFNKTCVLCVLSYIFKRSCTLFKIRHLLDPDLVQWLDPDPGRPKWPSEMDKTNIWEKFPHFNSVTLAPKHWLKVHVLLGLGSCQRRWSVESCGWQLTPSEAAWPRSQMTCTTMPGTDISRYVFILCFDFLYIFFESSHIPWPGLPNLNLLAGQWWCIV